ncbi:MAG: adenosylcobinamide-GDP ribazoletransferase [Acidobacteriota bacterium]
MLRHLTIAVLFLTRIPLRLDPPAQAEELPQAAAYFPLVGGAVGLIAAGAAWAGAQVWPLWLALLVALAFEALLTGGFHEDAVADFFDAFGGGWTREDVLRILKDSRVGSFGALALVVLFALRAGALSQLGAALVAGWVASAAVGRASSVLAMAALPPAADRQSLARDVGPGVGRRQALLAAALTLPSLAWIAALRPAHTAAALVAAALLGVFFIRYLDRRIGGVTGDCLGALCYLAQVAVLLALAADPGGAAPP